MTYVAAARRRLRRALKGSPDAFLRDARGIIHVGANVGQERETYRRHGLPVLWVEPIPEVFAQLVTNVAAYYEQTAVQALLADVEGREVELKIASNGGASSSILELGEHQDIWPDIAYVDRIPLLTRTLDSLLRDEGVEPSAYDALVMDTQGSELLVLQGAPQTLDGIRYVKSEAADFDAYVGGCRLDDLDAFLSERGFSRTVTEAFARHPSGGRYYDVLYVRR